MKRNVERVRQLKRELQALEREHSELYDRRVEKAQMIKVLNRDIEELTIDSERFGNMEEAKKAEIGRMKGLHCIAKHRDPAFEDYYWCWCRNDNDSNSLKHFYRDLCFGCRLTEDQIAIKAMMHKVKGENLVDQYV